MYDAINGKNSIIRKLKFHLKKLKIKDKAKIKQIDIQKIYWDEVTSPQNVLLL